MSSLFFLENVSGHSSFANGVRGYVMFDPDTLREQLSDFLSTSNGWSGTVFRFAAPRYASPEEFLRGEGGFKADSRWFIAGLRRVTYTSLDVNTATQEAFAKSRYYALDHEKTLPLVLGAARVSIPRVLDLSEGSVLLKALGIFVDQICEVDWRHINSRNKIPHGLTLRALLHDHKNDIAFTQTIGLVAFDVGFGGLLVPSAAARVVFKSTSGTNLVYFPDRLAEAPKIVNSEEMPRPSP